MVDRRDQPKPKFLLSAETEYSAESQLFCKEQNSRIQNSTYPLVQNCHYSVSAEYSVRYSAEYFGRHRFRSALNIALSDSHSTLLFGFSMMEQVRVCAVCSTENRLGSSMNHIQGGTATVMPYKNDVSPLTLITARSRSTMILVPITESILPLCTQ